MDDEAAISLTDATCVLQRALVALAVGDVSALELFTEDVIGDSPMLRVRSRSELEYQLLDREGALSNVDFDLDRVEQVAANTVVGWWRLAGDHTGDALFNEDVYFAPTGQRIRMSVTTDVVFRRRRIAIFRSLYDHGDLLNQMRGRPSRPDAS